MQLQQLALNYQRANMIIRRCKVSYGDGQPRHRQSVDFTRRRTIFDVIQEVLNDFANLILPGYRVWDGDDNLDGKVCESASEDTLDK